MTHSRFPQTLEYLYGLLPMYQRQGKAAFKKDLTNIRELCWQLGLPQWHFPSILIAGTNGKGSVSAMINSILMEAGLKTGMYTSPHLRSFTERIRVKGKTIPQKSVVEFVEKNQHIIEDIQPSFFELTVGMAFDYFAKKEIDIAVVEVGLGGRLDSTNILSPELCVITNISYDHQALLGNTLGEIAYEKAGIIKRYTPVIIGEKHLETQEVFQQKAHLEEAPIIFASERYQSRPLDQNLENQRFELTEQDEFAMAKTYDVGLAGLYQEQNLRTAICAIEQMQEDGWDIPEKAIKRGLKKVVKNSALLGRMQVLQENPLAICDTGHNEAGVKAVLDQIKNIPHENLHMVWGMVSDKDHSTILQLLPEEAQYYFVKPNIPRGLDSLDLQIKAATYNLNGAQYSTVSAGYQAALEAANGSDLIFVGGSTFVVAEVIPENPA